MPNIQQINSRSIKENVSLVDLLSRLNFRPVRTSGKELVYLSMLRDSDTSPSFTVNDKLSVWYDHGQGKGGNVIDFGLAFWPQLSFSEVLEKILNVTGQHLPVGNSSNENKRSRLPIKIPHYKILEIKEIHTNPAISNYLRSRGILDVAEGRLKEIYYYVEDQKKSRKHFFAAGWPNELGGWEVRNLYFKGCLGHKAISFVQGSNDRLAVFEGYVNYLSWLTDNPYTADNVLILNSVSLLLAGIKKASAFADVSLYFDHDNNGHSATAKFIAAIPSAKDYSSCYEGYNDYNDRMIAVSQAMNISR